jgi:tyrosine-protein phosphatase YwqE
MQVLRDSKGMVLPVERQPIGQFMKIKGFRPVLIHIERNINLPAKLAENPENLPQQRLTEAPSMAGKEAI